MSGEKNLGKLLQSMSPEMREGVFVFCSLPEGEAIPAALRPKMLFEEKEGTTLVLLREEAKEVGLPFQYASRLITLNVHSSLEAVGFLAIIARHLAGKGISLNVASAFYHDHLFVPEREGERALRLLKELARGPEVRGP